MLNKEQYFPTNVYVKDILDGQLLRDLKKYILDRSGKEEGFKRSNVKGWHSQTNFHESPHCDKLKQELYKMHEDIFIEEQLLGEPSLRNMWANINYEGGHNRNHIHPGALFSGVFYVESFADSGNLKLYDPRPGIHYTAPLYKMEKDFKKELWREVSYPPLAGRIIIFPAWLWHSVEINESHKPRISISFNFIQKLTSPIKMSDPVLHYKDATGRGRNIDD